MSRIPTTALREFGSARGPVWACNVVRLYIEDEKRGLVSANAGRSNSSAASTRKKRPNNTISWQQRRGHPTGSSQELRRSMAQRTTCRSAPQRFPAPAGVAAESGGWGRLFLVRDNLRGHWQVRSSTREIRFTNPSILDLGFEQDGQSFGLDIFTTSTTAISSAKITVTARFTTVHAHFGRPPIQLLQARGLDGRKPSKSDASVQF